MARKQHYLKLQYLSEYELGQSPAPRSTNVPLRTPASDLVRRLPSFDMNFFGWHATRKFEGRDDSEESEGIWPINALRCDRRFGNPGFDLYPQGTPINSATEEIYAAAYRMRVLCYHRLANASDVRELIDGPANSIRYASEVTTDWYDPPDGKIDVIASDRKTLGTHAVPLIQTDIADGELRFVFRNSWGGSWGDQGFGSISAEHFGRFLVESWNSMLLGITVPYEANHGLICLEWKWAPTEEHALHVREIVEAESGQRLAWAFCKKRGEYLDVEEFFVWPTERGKGYGRQLAWMVRQLAKNMRRPLRLLVSYADTEPENESNLNAAANLLGVTLFESGEKWVQLFGTGSPVRREPIRNRPLRPAIPVETLRPSDEPPIDAPTDYLVYFGTNRALVDPNNVLTGFNYERSNELKLGRVLVRIPQTTRFGSRGKLWHVFLSKYRDLKPEVFQTTLIASETELGEELRTYFFPEWNEASHNLLFVHGFDTTFEGAITQAARLVRLP
jgi:GNAT superfamily N-acetyltransferase